MRIIRYELGNLIEETSELVWGEDIERVESFRKRIEGKRTKVLRKYFERVLSPRGFVDYLSFITTPERIIRHQLTYYELLRRGKIKIGALSYSN